mmetsp:Transcript_66835/g.178669  ORF Transcript_66835/g.178669 Transcript_66835/m.178669 type:complete len:218 (-) Transcript_66835:118-771(-)
MRVSVCVFVCARVRACVRARSLRRRGEDVRVRGMVVSASERGITRGVAIIHGGVSVIQPIVHADLSIEIVAVILEVHFERRVLDLWPVHAGAGQTHSIVRLLIQAMPRVTSSTSARKEKEIVFVFSLIRSMQIHENWLCLCIRSKTCSWANERNLLSRNSRNTCNRGSRRMVSSRNSVSRIRCCDGLLKPVSNKRKIWLELVLVVSSVVVSAKGTTL